MEKLEICVNALRVNRLAYVSKEMERCRNCSEYTMLRCDKYKAYIPTSSIPIRQGRNAIDYMKRFYRDKISIEGLPHELEE